MLDLLEKHIQLQSPSRIEELVKIFIHALKVCNISHTKVCILTASKMEIGFWEMFPAK